MNQEQDQTSVAILTGRKEEYEPLLQQIENPERKLSQNHPYFQKNSNDYSVTLTHTGPGPDAVQQTLGNLGSILEPDLILILGTGGSIHEDVSFGELFVPTAVTDQSGDRWLYPNTELIQWLLGFHEETIDREQVRTGPVTTVDSPVIDRKDREELHGTTQAMVADMESYEIARWFEEESSPESIGWVCARIVSDNIDTNSTDQVKENQEQAITLLSDYMEPVLSDIQ